MPPKNYQDATYAEDRFSRLEEDIKHINNALDVIKEELIQRRIRDAKYSGIALTILSLLGLIGGAIGSKIADFFNKVL